jgi:hypothetical protein
MDEKANGGSPHRGRVSFFARAKKETKESTPRMARQLAALRAFAVRLRDATSVSRRATRGPPARGPSGLRAKAGDARACHTGFLKTPSERAEHRARPGVFARLLIEPEGEAEYSWKSGGLPCRRTSAPRIGAPRVHVPGELGSRPAEARRAGNRAILARRSDRVSFSLVTFSWTSKRKSPRVQGRSHPQLFFQRRRSRHDTFMHRRERHDRRRVQGWEHPAFTQRGRRPLDQLKIK